MQAPYLPPTFESDGFNCPHCGAFSHQNWERPGYGYQGRNEIEDLFVCFCGRCKNYSLWVEKEMVYPLSSTAPLPLDDMPEDVKDDFLEARNVVNSSPRSAAALLRLALQKLMPHVGETGENINNDIANLVRKGLPERIQKALDAVRVIGNNAVHPGQLDIRDDVETALRIFGLLNVIVDMLITQPQKIDEIYESLPESTKEAIEKRDRKT